ACLPRLFLVAVVSEQIPKLLQGLGSDDFGSVLAVLIKYDPFAGNHQVFFGATVVLGELSVLNAARERLLFTLRQFFYEHTRSLSRCQPDVARRTHYACGPR